MRAYAGAAVAAATADGVAAELDSLRPGITTIIGFHSISPGMVVHLGGHSVVLVSGDAVFSRRCSWVLPNTTLLPDIGYAARLAGSAVEVARRV